MGKWLLGGGGALVQGYDQLLLTEFKYDCEVSESFTKIPLPFFDQGQPQWIYLLIKKYVSRGCRGSRVLCSAASNEHP